MCLPGTMEAVATTAGQEEAPRQAPETGGLSRRAALAGAGVLGLGALLPRPALGQAERRGRRVRDLTHTFSTGFPVYVGATAQRRALNTFERDGFYAQEWTFGEHTGTHVDAPGHFDPDGRRVTALRAAELIAPLAVIDISAKAEHDPDAEVTLADVRRYERRYGRIRSRSVVAMYSGWEERLDQPGRYANADAGGTFHFPGFGIDAVEFLLDRRALQGIAVDTLSLDNGASQTFAVHKRLLNANRYGIENVANLGRVPARGAEVIVGVVPWEAGSGGPCRLLASY